MNVLFVWAGLRHWDLQRLKGNFTGNGGGSFSGHVLKKKEWILMRKVINCRCVVRI